VILISGRCACPVLRLLGGMPASRQPENTPLFKADRLAWLVLAILVIILMAIIPYGVDYWADESYAIATPTRYLMGDRPLVDSWDTNFSSAILTMPLLKTYVAVTGSNEGVVLAFRWLWVLVAAGTSVTALVVLRKQLSTWAALCVSLLPLLAPFSGYAGDWLWHILSVLVAVRLLDRPSARAWWHILPGILSALGIVANPSTVTVVPFFGCALWLAHRVCGRPAQRAMLGYAAGLLTLGATFLLALGVMSGPSVFQYLEYVVRPDDHDFGLAAQLTKLLSARSMVLFPIVIGLAVGMIAGRALKIRTSSLAYLTAICGSLLSLVLAATGRVYSGSLPQALPFVLALCITATGLVSLRDQTRPHQYLLALPSLGAGVGWFLGSNGGWFAAIQMSALILAAALFWWPQAVQESGRADVALRRGAAFSLWSMIAVAAVAGLFLRPSGLIFDQRHRMQQGPFAGIHTTASEAFWYERMVHDLTSLSPAPGRIAFLERFPLGYLLQQSKPGTYSTWVTSASSNRLQTYVDLTGNAPDRIVLTRFAADFRDGEFPLDVNLERFETDYRRVYVTPDFLVYDHVQPENGGP